jgi:hypothetical protein
MPRRRGARARLARALAVAWLQCAAARSMTLSGGAWVAHGGGGGGRGLGVRFFALPARSHAAPTRRLPSAAARVVLHGLPQARRGAPTAALLRLGSAKPRVPPPKRPAPRQAGAAAAPAAARDRCRAGPRAGRAAAHGAGLPRSVERLGTGGKARQRGLAAGARPLLRPRPRTGSPRFARRCALPRFTLDRLGRQRASHRWGSCSARCGGRAQREGCVTAARLDAAV